MSSLCSKRELDIVIVELDLTSLYIKLFLPAFFNMTIIMVVLFLFNQVLQGLVQRKIKDL
jgi:hypothetical protein